MGCHFQHETALARRGFRFVAGIDEAGRGPLAGPVVAAAARLPEGFEHAVLNDSKKLSEKRRERLYEELSTRADIVWAVAIVDAAEIDRINILQATYVAMRQAAEKLPTRPDHVLIDGRRVPGFPIEQTALVGGDATSYSIAAASIFAKVTRDRLMLELDRTFPEYGFAKHKGYGTALHLERLRQHGPAPIHRRSFLPVAQCELPLG